VETEVVDELGIVVLDRLLTFARARLRGPAGIARLRLRFGIRAHFRLGGGAAVLAAFPVVVVSVPARPRAPVASRSPAARPRAPGLARTNGEERQEQARGEERRSLHAANVTQARSSSREPRAPPEIGSGAAAEHRRARNSSRRNEALRRMTKTFRAWLQHTCGSPARRSAGHSGPVTSPPLCIPTRHSVFRSAEFGGVRHRGSDRACAEANDPCVAALRPPAFADGSPLQLVFANRDAVVSSRGAAGDRIAVYPADSSVMRAAPRADDCYWNTHREHD